MVPLILRVLIEQDGESAEVPLTPETTCRDVIECVRDPGEESCYLVVSCGNTHRTLSDNERPLDILQRWGPGREHVRFALRYSMVNGGGTGTRNGMKEPEIIGESLRQGGVELTVGELEAMAMRQQEQMASQRQLLAAKEQRLRFLKQHEARHHQVAAEHERLRRLRDRVEAQELKLSKLRALRGQVDHSKVNNASLTSDLDSIRALFNEKEKELSLAVAKVEELTRQLEEVRRGKQNQPPSSAPSQELERLRRELMYRNKLNEQQTARLSEQREALSQRQREMASIDKRIGELQERLHRKRILNQQLATQISSASSKGNVVQQQGMRNPVPHMGMPQSPMYPQMNNSIGKPMMHHPMAGPNMDHHYQHSQPYPTNLEHEYAKRAEMMKQETQRAYNAPNPEDLMGPRKASLTAPATHHYIQETKTDEQHEADNLPEFGASKSDPKYQTLPYNTKFAGPNHPGIHRNVDKRASGEGNENTSDNVEGGPKHTKNLNNNTLSANNNFNHVNNNMSQQHMNVAHSIPILSGASKGLAMALANQKQPPAAPSASPTSSTSSYSSLAHLAPRMYNSSLLNSTLIARGQPVGGASSTTSSTSSLATSSSVGSANQPDSSAVSGTTTQTVTSRFTLPPTPLISDIQKPVNTLPSSSLQQQQQQHPSNIYQTSSTKIHPVQPQIISSTPQVIVKEETETSKPALPPKPAVPVKPTPPPPPRQTHNSVEVRQPSVEVTSELPDTGLTVLKAPCHTRGGATVGESVEGSSGEVSEPPPLPSEPPPEEPESPIIRKPSDQIIKAKPLTIRKQPVSELPRLRSYFSKDDSSDEKRGSDESLLKKLERTVSNEEETHFKGQDDSGESSSASNNSIVGYGNSRRIEMPPEFLFPEDEAPPADLISSQTEPPSQDQVDRAAPMEDSDTSDHKDHSGSEDIPRRVKKGNLKTISGEKQCLSRRVSFDPLALLLDASLEGELQLVMRIASQFKDPSAANDEGITALHNAVCAGHYDIVTFLVRFGCDVNPRDSDGWTPLHCAASCNNVAMVKFLVEHGACIFATTLSDHETAAEKCEEDEEGFDGCSEYLYTVQEKLGIMNNGVVYSVYDYDAQHPDELTFKEGDKLVVLRKGDEWEREWWWARLDDKEGYIPRNLLGLYPRVRPNKNQQQQE